MCGSCSAKNRQKDRVPWSAYAPLGDTSYKRCLWKARYFAIKSRCLNKNNKDYKDYGGRGIKIHPALKTPEGFVKVILKLKGWQNPKRSLDRIDNDGDYSPSNLRMATKKQQTLNRRPSHLWYDAKNRFKKFQRSPL
jgi:hypothetical protein